VATIANVLFDLLTTNGYDYAVARRASKSDPSALVTAESAASRLDMLAEIIDRLNLSASIDALKHA
jgi:hypothetical protein